MAHNEVAHALYRKCGFRDEGCGGEPIGWMRVMWTRSAWGCCCRPERNDLADPEGRRQSVRRLDEGRNALMKGILLRWLARYDAWCQGGDSPGEPALLRAGAP